MSDAPPHPARRIGDGPPDLGPGAGPDRGPGTGGRDLTQGPIMATLIAFSIPTLMSNVLQSLNGSVNSVWVGQFLGEEALAATANTNILMFLVMSTVFGFGMASTVRVGHNIGAGNLDGAKRVFGTAMGFIIAVTVVVAILGYHFSPLMLDLLGTPGKAWELALAYLRVSFVAMPFMMVSIMVTMALRGAGDAITPLKFMVLSVLVDIVMNPMLIRGIGPFPELGIAGAAYSSVIANMTGLFAMLIYTYTAKRPLRLSGAEFRYLWPQWEELKFILVKGLPMGAQMLVVTASGIVIIGLINHEGVLTTAAYGAAAQLQTYIQMPAMAIGAGVSAMAAQNIGAGKWDRLSRITWSGIVLTVGITSVVAVLMLLFDRPALGLFLGANSPAVELARHIQYLSLWSFILFAGAMTLFATMRAHGIVLAPLIILAISQFVVRLVFYHYAYPHLGADAIWLAFGASALAASIMAVIAYRYYGNRRDRRHMDSDEAAEGSQADGDFAGRMSPSV